MLQNVTPSEVDALPVRGAATDADWSAQLDFARFSHANLQDMVKLADSKSTALIAVQSVVLTLLGKTPLGLPESFSPPGWEDRRLFGQWP